MEAFLERLAQPAHSAPFHSTALKSQVEETEIST